MKCHPRQNHRKQHGSALIFALMIIVLSSAILLMLQIYHYAAIKRTGALINYEIAYTGAIGVETWGLGKLADLNKHPIEERVRQTWPITLKTNDASIGEIRREIFDAQGYFNVNSMAANNTTAGFENLLYTVKVPAQSRALIVQNINDYIGTESLPSQSGEYEQAKPPYRPKNAPLIQPSELRLIAGITPEIYRALYPYITTLPGAPPININTASAIVLMTLNKDSTLAQMQAAVQEREKRRGFASENDFIEWMNKDMIQINPSLVTVESQFYLIHARVKRQGTIVNLYSLVHLPAGEEPIKTNVLWRTQRLP